MRVEIKMPKLSDTMEEGTVVKWRVAVGDSVKRGDIIAEVETDKATMEMEAFDDGKVADIWVHEGQTVPVETVIAMLSTEGEQGGDAEDEPAASDDAAPAGEEQEAAEPSNEDFFPDDDDFVLGGDEPSAVESEPDAAVDAAEAADTAVPEDAPADDEIEVEVAMPGAAEPASEADEVPAVAEPGEPSGTDEATDAAEDERVAASPSARQLAEQYGISLDQVKGTGPGGRILREDVEASLMTDSSLISDETDDFMSEFDGELSTDFSSPPAAGEPEAMAVDESMVTSDEETEVAAPQPAPEPASIPDTGAAPAEAPGTAAEPEEVPGKKSVKIRRLVARKMVDSWQHAPHFFVTVAVDITDVIRFRKDLGVTINDFIVAATSHALQEHPWVNSHWVDGEAVEQKSINIALAVATEKGLYNPVVRDCRNRTLKEIGEETKRLAEKAHSGQLAEEDMADGTFTISNMGMLGVESFSAIITPPQAAVLAVGTVRGEVIVDEHEEMSVAPMVRLTLSADHRILDGADAADFLATLKSYLEAPITLVASQGES